MPMWCWRCSNQRMRYWKSCTVFLAHAQKTSSAHHHIGGHHSTLEGHSGETSNKDTSIPTDTSRPGDTGATSHVSHNKSHTCNTIDSTNSTHSSNQCNISSNRRSYRTYKTITIPIIDIIIIIIQQLHRTRTYHNKQCRGQNRRTHSCPQHNSSNYNISNLYWIRSWQQTDRRFNLTIPHLHPRYRWSIPRPLRI